LSCFFIRARNGLQSASKVVSFTQLGFDGIHRAVLPGKKFYCMFNNFNDGPSENGFTDFFHEALASIAC